MIVSGLAHKATWRGKLEPVHQEMGESRLLIRGTMPVRTRAPSTTSQQ